MFYYQILPQAKLPRNLRGHFTYTSEEALNPGTIVRVEFRRALVLGLVWQAETAPKFDRPGIKLKPIESVVGLAPAYYLPLLRWLAEYYFTSAHFLWQMISPETSSRRLPAPNALRHPALGNNYAQLRVRGRRLPLIKELMMTNDSLIDTYELTSGEQMVTYIKLIEHEFAKRRSALLLVPTLAKLKTILTFLPSGWQDRIIVMTSRELASKGRHWQIWFRILNESASQPLLIIGTRSAVFAPLNNLGLIIIDEVEASDYKQYDQNPRYDARTVAGKIIQLTASRVKMFTSGHYF